MPTVANIAVPMLIDTHCHLDFDRFDEDRANIMTRAAEAGVTQIIVPAIDLDNCSKVLALADTYSNVYAAVGVHPNSTEGWDHRWIAKIRKFAEHPKVVAIGEIGLDYYWDRVPKAVQHEAFRAQLLLADELSLPVIIHNRESSDDVVALLADSPLNGKKDAGVLHSFSAPADIATAVLAMGFYLGFTGPLTYKNADNIRRIAATAPLDRLLIETDAPYLAPQKKRGKRNEPAYVAAINERLAALHQISDADMARQTTENARRLFRLDSVA